MEQDSIPATAPTSTTNFRPDTKVDVDVVAESEGPNISFRLAPGNEASAKYVTGPTTIEFPNGPDLYKIHFRIVDKDCSYKLKFDRGQPICAADGNACPTSGGIKSKELDQPEPTKDRDLKIDNYNSAVGPVGFALFFKDMDSGAKLPPFDPIMDNGGGGGPKPFIGESKPIA